MKVLLSLIILICIVYGVWFFAVQFGTVDISTYKGDGKIKSISGGFLSKGVEIELPTTGSRQEVFSLNGLPITGRDYYILVQLPEKFINNTEFTIKAIDKNNNVIIQFNIRAKNAQVILYDGKTKLYYNPEGYLQKDKINRIDKLLIYRSTNDSSEGIKFVLMSGGNV